MFWGRPWRPRRKGDWKLLRYAQSVCANACFGFLTEYAIRMPETL